MGATRDITERRKAEEALRESEQRYRTLADNMKDIIWTVDLNLKLTYVSPSIQEMSGYSAEEVMSMGLMDLPLTATPASLERIEPIISKVLAANEKGQDDLPEGLALELDLIHKDGSIIPVEMNIKLLRDPAGHPIGFLGTTRDITKRKKAEEALVQSEEWHRALIETAGTSGQGIVVLQNTPDKEAMIAFANDAASEMTGYSLTEMLLLSAWDIFDSPELGMIQKRYRMRQRGEKHSSLYETTLLRKDGTALPVEASISTMIYRGKVATVVFSKDITERKSAEKQLRSLNKQLRRLSAYLNNVREDEMKRIAGISINNAKISLGKNLFP
jgi:PAS domain S-box-containing protein